MAYNRARRGYSSRPKSRGKSTRRKTYAKRGSKPRARRSTRSKRSTQPQVIKLVIEQAALDGATATNPYAPKPAPEPRKARF